MACTTTSTRRTPCPARAHSRVPQGRRLGLRLAAAGVPARRRPCRCGRLPHGWISTPGWNMSIWGVGAR
jgi:hypothetical protein